MRNIDRFNNNQFSRVSRNSKIIYQFAKHGSKGLSKVTPSLVFIDAVVSLGELFVSYSNYRQVKEQNKQLEIEIKTLSKEFNNLKITLGIKEEKFRYELKQNSNLIEKKLKQNRQNSDILQKAYQSSKQYFFKMKNEVEKYNQEHPFSKEAKGIEKKYHEVLALYMNTTLEAIGG